MDTALCVNGSESRCFTQRLSSNVSLISSCAPPLSGHWKHLRGDNKAKKIRSLSSPLLCRHFDPAPDARSTNFWRGKSLWYAFPRAQKGKAKTKNLWLQGKQRHPEIHEVALFFFFLTFSTKRKASTVGWDHLFWAFRESMFEAHEHLTGWLSSLCSYPAGKAEDRSC